MPFWPPQLQFCTCPAGFMKIDNRKVEKGQKINTILLHLKKNPMEEIYVKLQAQETYQLELTFFSTK